MRLLRLSLFSVLLISGGCTLNTFPQTVQISMGRPPPKVAVRGVRSGPELNDMKCYGLVVAGAPGEVVASQIEGRSPTCLGLGGAFFGPYTYDAMAAGVSITLSPASYNFSLVGFHNVSDCGSGVSDLYKTGNTVQNYAIGPPVSADLRSVTTVQIPGNLYVPAAAVDRTPGCPPPATQDCDGATACDTFTAANDTLLQSHPLDSGGSWFVALPLSPYIFNNAARASSTDVTGVNYGAHTTSVGTDDIQIAASVSLGGWSLESSAGLTARYVDASNFVGFMLNRENIGQVCTLVLFQYVSGGFTLLDSEFLDYVTECPFNEFSTMTLTTNGTRSEGTYRGHTVVSLATSVNGGIRAGFIARNEGSLTSYSLVDFWRADLVP